MYKKMQEGSDSSFGQAYQQAAKQISEQGAVGVHTYTEEEKEAFVEHINSTLGKDPDLKDYLPINVKNDDLFEKVKDGVLLCKLINSSVKDTIDEADGGQEPDLQSGYYFSINYGRCCLRFPHWANKP